MKANWFLDQAEGRSAIPLPAPTADTFDNAVEGVDPFDEADLPASFMPGGPAITIDTPDEDLDSRLNSLLRREARLDARGITCALKDKGEAQRGRPPCLACPVSKADDESHGRFLLCRLGVQQDLVITAMDAKRLARDHAAASA